MLVRYYVIFVFGVERLVLGRNIDFLRGKVRATIEFLGYHIELPSYFTGKKDKRDESADRGDRREPGTENQHIKDERGIYLEKVREAGLFEVNIVVGGIFGLVTNG